MGYIRKPLPDDMNVHAWSAADVMVLLAEQCGIPIRATIDLRLQALSDLFRSLAENDDGQGLDHLIVIDERAAEGPLEADGRAAPAREPRASPQRARRDAEQRAGEDRGRDQGRDVADRDRGAPCALTQEPAIVFEDADFTDYGREMNRTISLRPHGRSRFLY
ncbi:hypothetical protein GCM10011380_31360 [Sphingomonas metalli]|uniref:Uncharacterized protein n=1 Tax=Sphingomonas metalli TaxID=1779358 RepID=A0A916TCR1_9SPHN|nr:hypothetical protein [Sphingomonas metalli]GGB39566.1 hypothetical protein GCM10011380_31360 [Sphingomonas metalli]